MAHLSFAQVDLFQGWHTRRCYERTRGQLFCSIHYKSLKRQDISGVLADKDDEHRRADLGKIVNLMQSVIFRRTLTPRLMICNRGDSYAVSQRFWEFSGIFASPVRLAIALTFLYQYVTHLTWPLVLISPTLRILGWSALAGVVVILLACVFNYPLAQYNIYVSACRIRHRGLTDTSIDHEVLVES
jgi:hypothetical protein